MNKNNELAEFIIQQVGGKDNIIDLRHCMTRLRFKLKDYDLVNTDQLKNEPGIISVSQGGGRFQVIIGNSVEDVYTAIIEKIGFQEKDNSSISDTEHKGILTSFIDVVTKIITPILGCLIAAGLIKGLLALLAAMQIIVPADGAYVIINAIGDALFYFFPILLGYTSAETFGLNKFIGMLLGAILVYPNITADLTGGEVIYSLLNGTVFQLDAFSSFMGIPVFFPGAGYASTVIPIIVITYFSSKVEKKLKKLIPAIIGFAVTPFLTLLICGVLGILIVGPITNVLSNLISWLAITLCNFSPLLATIVIAMIYQPLVIFGLHWPLITLAIQNVGLLGYDYIWPMMYAASFAQTAVVMAVSVKTKSKQEKAASIPAIISGLMCIIEPAIYGFTLPIKKRFFISCISATVGGIIITLTNSNIYGIAIGVLGFPVFIKPDGDLSGMFIAIGACVITMIIAFTLTVLTYQDKETNSSADEDMYIIHSPVMGRQIPMSEVTDKTFKSEVLGASVAIAPTEGKVLAPCNGIVKSLFKTGHAIGFEDESGNELLIHIGIDTVQLEGRGFTKKVNQGDYVKQGDILVEFNIEEIKNSGLSTDVLIVLTNSKDYNYIEKNPDREISYLDALIKIQSERRISVKERIR